MMRCRLLRKRFGSIPLRYVVMVPFVAEIMLAVGIIGALAIWNGHQAVRRTVEQLQSEVSDRVEDKLTNYLSTPHLLNAINAEAIRQGSLPIEDPDTARYFWTQLKSLHSISWIYYGNQSAGEFIGVNRLPQGDFEVVINAQSRGNQGVIFALNPQGQRSEELRQQREYYDARIRPWYQAGVQAGEATWSDFYTGFLVSDLILSAVLPIYDNSGSLLGVSGVDVSPDDISAFLEKLQIGAESSIFIIDRQNRMVANSTGEQNYTIIDDSASTQVEANQVSDQRIQSAFQALTREYGSLPDITQRQQFDFTVADAAYFAEVLPFQDGRGIDWLIVVSVAQSTFLAQIDANTGTTLWLCLITLVFTIGLSGLTARWITEPIIRLNQASQAIASGDFDQRVNLHRQDELGSLARAFNRMARQLRNSFLILEHRNHELEAQVDDRTQHLLRANEQLRVEVMERRLAEAALREQVTLAELSSDIGVALTEQDALAPMLQDCTDALKTRLGVTSIRIWTFDSAEGLLVLQAKAGADPLPQVPDRMPKTWQGLGQVAMRQQPYYLNQRAEDLDIGDRDWLRKQAIVAIVAYPLLVEHELVGVLALWSRAPFSPSTQQALTAIASEMALGVKHKIVERMLRERELLYRSIVENTSDLVAINDLDGNFIYTSPNYRSLGYEPDALIGEPWSRIIHPDDLELVSQSLQSLVTDHKNSKTSAYRLLDSQGQWRWYISTVSVAPNTQKPDGSPLYYVSISRDVTERITYEEQLKQAKEAAEVANRAKSEFLANMSHELRTPLNGILGFAQLLKRDLHLPPNHLKGLDIIHRNGQHLLAFINDVLDLSKIEAHRMEVQTVTFKLQELLATVIELFLPRADEKTIQFRTELSSALPRVVEGDDQKLRQVLINLLGNAIKFTPAGEVLFQVDYVNEDARQAQRIRFLVEDTGIGIPADKLEDIFQPFQQVTTPIRSAEGTGLGLSISYRLVELMGGTLHVTSELGTGSRFWMELTLPAVDITPPVPVTETTMPNYQPQLRAQSLPEPHRVELLTLAKIGDVQGILSYLEQIEQTDPSLRLVTYSLRAWAQCFKVRKIRDYLMSSTGAGSTDQSRSQ